MPSSNPYVLCVVGQAVDLSKYDVNVVATVMKGFLQSLPEPILTYKLYPRFIAAACMFLFYIFKTSLYSTLLMNFSSYSNEL